MVTTHTHAKNQGQIFKRSVDSKDTVQNDGETNTPDRITFPANAVGDESAFDRPHPVFSAQVIARVSGGSYGRIWDGLRSQLWS